MQKEGKRRNLNHFCQGVYLKKHIDPDAGDGVHQSADW